MIISKMPERIAELNTKVNDTIQENREYIKTETDRRGQRTRRLWQTPKVQRVHKRKYIGQLLE